MATKAASAKQMIRRAETMLNELDEVRVAARGEVVRGGAAQVAVVQEAELDRRLLVVAQGPLRLRSLAAHERAGTAARASRGSPRGPGST